MLKKIPVNQLRMGMHLHKLDGAWMQHSFWKTKFVIDNSADLKRLKDCGVAECWIDVALGLDVAAVVETEPAVKRPVAAPQAAAAPAAPVGAPAGNGQGDRPMAAELKQAAAICNRGRAAVTAMFNEARMGRTVDAETCLPLVQEISDSVQRNAGALVSLARLKSRDDYSYMHSVAVCAMMVSLARQSGMGEDACREAGLAGLMHDIGKALIPLEVLNKPGKLSDEEFALVRLHPEQGHGLLIGGQGVLESTLDVVLHHHEKVDGSGYPHRLPGDRISQLARMGAICDVYDAITSNRPYKAGWDPAESIARMASWKGHFDPPLFAAFVQSLGIYPTGSAVRLASGKLAVVVEQNPGNLVSPVVMVFYSTKSELPITPTRLDLARPGTHDRITGREEGAAAKFPNLNSLWADPEVLRGMKP
jgi:HD-GYP domain-containing protein (c-di-GMP phosphodiesterase class II)